MMKTLMMCMILFAPFSVYGKKLVVGDLVPNIKIQDVNGSDVSFHKILQQGPSVVIFYRGGWCPYCNLHLKDLITIESDLKSMGIQIFAISPDKPSELKNSLSKNKLNYHLYSDSKMLLAKAMGISFTVNNDTLAKYKKYGIDLESASNESHHQLPIPSVFLIKDRKIIFVHSDADYKIRLKADQILELAKKF